MCPVALVHKIGLKLLNARRRERKLRLNPASCGAVQMNLYQLTVSCCLNVGVRDVNYRVWSLTVFLLWYQSESWFWPILKKLTSDCYKEKIRTKMIFRLSKD